MCNLYDRKIFNHFNFWNMNDTDYLKPRMCKGCGDVEIEDEEIVCSDSCWKLYASETFYND